MTEPTRDELADAYDEKLSRAESLVRQAAILLAADAVAKRDEQIESLLLALQDIEGMVRMARPGHAICERIGKALGREHAGQHEHVFRCQDCGKLAREVEG